MGILRADRVSGLGGANAINGSVHFPNDGATGTGDYLRCLLYTSPSPRDS